MPNQVEILELTDLFLCTYDGLIDRMKFETWVDSKDLREWTTGEEGGCYSWEEYYDGGGAEIDLYKFLNSTKVFRPGVDFQNSLNKLYNTL